MSAVKKGESDERVFLTYEEAEAMLPDGDTIHTFAGGGMMLIGADWDRKSVLELFKTGKPELAGEMATSMGHGIVAFLRVDEENDTKSEPRFIQTKEQSE